MLFFVTTSPCREWVSCAPAAFLGCGSRFSCSLSGIEPWFPVTRYKHGRHVTYHRHLIGQTFERCVAGARAMRSAQSYPESPKGTPDRSRAIGFELIKALFPLQVGASKACISSRIATVIQVGSCHLRNLDWFNEPFAVSPWDSVNLDMHGLIFETSIWLLAGSTR